jgi:hypothetical protein
MSDGDLAPRLADFGCAVTSLDRSLDRAADQHAQFAIVGKMERRARFDCVFAIGPQDSGVDAVKRCAAHQADGRHHRHFLRPLMTSAILIALQKQKVKISEWIRAPALPRRARRNRPAKTDHAP